MKYSKTIVMIGSLIGIALIASPFAAFAKDNDANEDRGNKVSSHYSFLAQAGSRLSQWEADVGDVFGHAFSFGWNKNHGGQNGNGGDPATTTGVTYTNGILPPVINGVSSPTVLNVGVAGTWTVSASDPSNGNLSYSVDWGDNGPTPLRRGALAQPIFIQTATFTHAYSAPGVYTVTFTVKDNAELTSATSVTVHVIASQNTLVIGNVNAVSNRPHSATVSWTTNVKASGKIWYSTSAQIDTSASPQISRSTRVLAHTITLNNLQADTTYYFIVGSTDSSGATVISPEKNFATPAIASMTPTISSFIGPTSIPALEQGVWTVSASDPQNSTLSYSVNWGDNAPTPLLRKLPAYTQTSTFDHAYALPGTYTITVTATDAAGHSASATATVTVTAPTVNPLAISNQNESIGSTTINLAWNTNNAADSEIYYSTTSPVTIGASSTMALVDANQVTSHSEIIGNLATSTTYFIVIQSMDAANNVATSDQFVVTTSAN